MRRRSPCRRGRGTSRCRRCSCRRHRTSRCRRPSRPGWRHRASRPPAWGAQVDDEVDVVLARERLCAGGRDLVQRLRADEAEASTRCPPRPVKAPSSRTVHHPGTSVMACPARSVPAGHRSASRGRRRTRRRLRRGRRQRRRRWNSRWRNADERTGRRDTGLLGDGHDVTARSSGRPAEQRADVAVPSVNGSGRWGYREVRWVTGPGRVPLAPAHDRRGHERRADDRGYALTAEYPTASVGLHHCVVPVVQGIRCVTANTVTRSTTAPAVERPSASACPRPRRPRPRRRAPRAQVGSWSSRRRAVPWRSPRPRTR